jgi:hypothetical protein
MNAIVSDKIHVTNDNSLILTKKHLLKIKIELKNFIIEIRNQMTKFKLYKNIKTKYKSFSNLKRQSLISCNRATYMRICLNFTRSEKCLNVQFGLYLLGLSKHVPKHIKPEHILT